VAVQSDRSTNKPLLNLSPLTGEGVIVDLGTGDGLFVYQSARLNPNKFYIGIDANTRPLEKVSEKIHRKPAKGGLPNVLFIQSSVEDLPPELDGVANEIHIHFPWGSLLRAVATGDALILQKLRQICAPAALLEIVIGLDPERDQTEVERLGLESLSLTFIDEVLSPRYKESGFEMHERGVLPASEWPEFKTSWAKRLRGKPNRPLTYLIFEAE